ncbi:DUF3460 family protein [Nitrosomonas aestuarii]|uniref:DUF3460 family protein n=1 Tax=Nitrosomonas aestuarii TaxID=52441 RepID=UPI000D30EEC8|nr:DUF3460 family protein [Nitrosomonas aestuarii]PTN12885.1 uncharacterized protein DUF3460 [Nitrosomonas aestuarii]
MDYSYESEQTKFMREFLEKNPQVPDKRLEARGIWWDKSLNKEEQKRFKESTVPHKPYAYFSDFIKKKRK